MRQLAFTTDTSVRGMEVLVMALLSLTESTP